VPDLSKLSGESVQLPPGQVFEAVVNEDATKAGQLVTCTIPSVDPSAATDPCPWMPYTTEAGAFYPKKGDRAKVSENGDGPGVILTWWPAADAVPDVPRPLTPYTIEIFGPEPRAAEALEGDLSITSYAAPGSAFSSSFQPLDSMVTGTVVRAFWDVAWNSLGGTACGLQLVGFKSPIGEIPGEFFPITELTGQSKITPVHETPIVTAAVAALWNETRKDGLARNLGHRLKSDGVVKPLVFMSRVVMVLAT
jgi:hypothetical protein